MADREEFQKKLAELLAKAAAQGNRMTQEELAAFFRDENLTEEQMELVVEFLIDVLKLASLNTPDTLSNSFSMLGALILGDFAVQADGWGRKYWCIWHSSPWRASPSPAMSWGTPSSCCGWRCCC